MGRVDIARTLVDAGAKVDGASGAEALKVAVWQGDEATTRLLLAHGAPIDVIDTDGWSALRAARESGHETLEKLLADAGAREPTEATSPSMSPLVDATTLGELAVVRALIRAGVDPDEVDRDGTTALMAASSRRESGAMLRILLGAGASTDAFDNQGRTALMRAATAGRDVTVSLLLEAGADVDHRTNQGATALMSASEAGHASIVKKLLDAGANTDLETQDGLTAIELARKNDHAGVVELLERH